MRLPPFNPRVVIFISVFALSITPILFKLLNEVPTGIIIQYKLFFSLLFLWPITISFKKKEFKRVSVKESFKIIVASIFYVAHLFLLILSLQYTSIVSVALILSLQPIFLLIALFIFNKERFSFGTTISILITFIGSLLIFLGDIASISGHILLILSLLCITIFTLTIQKIKQSYSFVTYITLLYTCSFFIVLAYNLYNTPNQFFQYDISQWAYFVLLSIVPTFIGYSLVNWSFRWLRTQTISANRALEPLFTILLAYYIFSEQISAHHLLGGSIIIFGLLLSSISLTRKKEVTISKKVTQKH